MLKFNDAKTFNDLTPRMSFYVAVFVLASLCLREATALSDGAPPQACTTLTQEHPGVFAATPCPIASCPYTVSLAAIDGEETNGTQYRCGSRHTLRLESSGQAFRGLAVQVREATGSTTFSNDAAFVGQFVNAPMGGDWRIWSCDAPSATHTGASDKTAVDMTWEAPGGPTMTSVTVWFAITQNFIVIHPQLMGVTLSPDPAFCAPTPTTSPPPAPLELNFINDSPRVSGGNISADIQFSRPVQSLRCALTGFPYQDCSSGTVTFADIPPRDEKNRVYIIRAVGKTADGVRTVIRRKVRVEEEGFCIVHYINDGVTVDGDSATIEFQGTGEFDSFLCDLNRQGLEPCSSPQVYTGLSPGEHRLKVVPSIDQCGRRRRPQVIKFTV